MSDTQFTRPRDHAFLGCATFAQLARFSHTYMRVHDDKAVMPESATAHIYLLGNQDHCIKMVLIDKDFRTVDDPSAHECSVDSAWSEWLGYPESVDHGFKWTSCTGSVLTAQKVDERSPSGETLYAVECWPARGEMTCGYMDSLRRIGVRFFEIMPQWLAPKRQPQPATSEQDVEPDWCPIELPERPPSLC